MNILVCGGAGYVGSHMVRTLLAAGHEVSVLDNLSTGFAWAIPDDAFFLKADLLDFETVADFLRRRTFDVVMHFSALSLVGESVQRPQDYYMNNVVGTLNLLRAMRSARIEKFVFSSTAATFGNPVSDLIDEKHPQQPINPYGQSKLMVEKILADYAAAYGLRSVSLRYFNAAGADASAEIGEAHDPETHLIPNILRSCLGRGSATRLKLFGNDYPTPDGTCVRDYIHVNDLADAHLRAVHYMNERSGAHAFNLGNGQGFSVLQVIRAAEKIVGVPIAYEVAPRRSGDPATLVADSELAQKELGWSPKYKDISAIIETAWRWHQHFHGSGSEHMNHVD